MTKADYDKQLERNAAAGAQQFADFIKVIGALRHPVSGCPWDLEQNHETLRRYMLEEAYEASVAMGDANPKHISEELGDVLLQVVLNAQIGADAGHFTIQDVVQGIKEKMVRRHPHVFAADTHKVQNSGEVRQQWAEIKAKEKGGQDKPKSLFAGCEKITPALSQAAAIGKRSKDIQFDWTEPREVLAQVQAELKELTDEAALPQNMPRIREELGDLFFTLAQYARHLGLDPEVIAQDGNQKFLRRFAAVEALGQAQGIDVKKASMAEKERLWQQAKAQEKKVT